MDAGCAGSQVLALGPSVLGLFGTRFSDPRRGPVEEDLQIDSEDMDKDLLPDIAYRAGAPA